MNKPFTKLAKEAIYAATECANELNHSYIGTEHILAGLAETDGSVSQKVLVDNKITSVAIKDLIEKTFEVALNVVVSDGENFSPKAEAILELAGIQAEKFHSKTVGTEHLLLAILEEEDSSAMRILVSLGANLQKMKLDIVSAMGIDANQYKEQLAASAKNKNKKSILKDFSTDLTFAAKEGKLDPITGRENEIERMVQILSRRTRCRKNQYCIRVSTKNSIWRNLWNSCG